MRGLGDLVAKGAKAIGFEQRPGCGCARRQELLNRWVPFGSRGITVPARVISGGTDLWGGILDPARAITWENVGIPGGIPNRTAPCPGSPLSPGATAAQINAAIQNCSSGQVLRLNSGTYNLTAGIDFANKNNVTLRGAGPDATFINFSGRVSCGGPGANVCFRNGDLNDPGNPHNTANWTAGYAKGATVITLDNVTNIVPGTLLILDQLNDGNTDTGNIWVNSVLNVTSNDGPGGGGRTGREQQQIVKVVGVSGFNVTITPGLYMPNWRAGQNPGAWWSSQVPTVMSGIEDLSIDSSGDTGSTASGIFFFNAYNCWVKNVRGVVLAGAGTKRSHVRFYQSAASVVRDSYFYGAKSNASESYGIEMFEGASDILVENNIVHHNTIPFQAAAAASGSVIAYNYSFDDDYTNVTWMQGSSYHHAAGVNFILHEGNQGTGFMADNVHGPANFITAFRNQWTGWEPGKTQQTVPVHVYTFNRFFNIVGNVLGRGAYHNTVYETKAGGSSSSCDIGIYALGWGGNCSHGTAPPDDTTVATSLMRWGNYDVFNNNVRFVLTEDGDGAPTYPALSSPNPTLPPSFYLPSKPLWWGTIPWPAVGPDVNGGDVISGTGASSTLGGHAYKMPARVCFDSLVDDPSYAAGTVKVFNANNCYSSTAPPPPPGPYTPSVITVISAGRFV